MAIVLAACAPGTGAPSIGVRGPSYEFRNGRWFDGRIFQPGTRYTVAGRLSDRRPAVVDSVIDLGGAFVVPAFGEDHNHNAVPSDTGIAHRYLHDGIFYVKNPDNLPRERANAAGRFNVPASIDVAFANGGLTGPGGHPIELVQRNVARGAWKPSDGEGAFLYTIGSAAELDERWPAILASHPDFVKTYLLFSDEYAQRLADSSTVGWRGLDPALLPSIVRKAHDAGLRVTTHVETAADFRNAVAAGVDEINHLPGFRPEGNDLPGYRKLDRYRLTASDARKAAERRVTVATTVSEVVEILKPMREGAGPDGDMARDVWAMLANNLRLLRDAGVNVVIGSDRYRTTSLPEVMGVRELGVFSDTALLRMWSLATPRAIFPDRKFGTAPGDEASFVVLDGNPLDDFRAVERIRLRVKGGVILP
ncbi:MAG TPA: amidohydrolase family protein [Gemmatimonadaceae bacterium]